MKKDHLEAIDYFRSISQRKDTYYKVFDIAGEKGDRIEFIADSNLAKGMTVKYKVLDGIYIYRTDCMYHDFEWQGAKTYIDDAIVIYKLLSGTLNITLTSGRQLVLHQGDILNASGNYAINTFHSLGRNIQLIGLICYYQKMLDSVRQMEWDNSFLEELYYDEHVQDGIVYRGDIQIDALIDTLDAAIANDNKILIKAKTLELLSISAVNYKRYIGKKTPTCSKTQLRIAEEVRTFLDNHLDAYFPMPYLAKKFTISLTSLKTAFKELYDSSPYQYHINRRLEKAKMLLKESDLKIVTIYESIGYSCHSNFVKAFQKKYHCLPSHYRNNRKH